MRLVQGKLLKRIFITCQAFNNSLLLSVVLTALKAELLSNVERCYYYYSTNHHAQLQYWHSHRDWFTALQNLGGNAIGTVSERTLRGNHNHLTVLAWYSFKNLVLIHSAKEEVTSQPNKGKPCS